MSERERLENIIQAEKRNQVKIFFDLTKEEKKELAEKVESFKGTVRLFVHPFYDLHHPSFPGDDIESADAGKSELVRIGLGRILKKSVSAPPIFVLEEAEKMKEAADFLVAVPGIEPKQNNPVYLIPSFPTSAEPFISNPIDLYSGTNVVDNYKRKFQERHSFNFRELAERLKTLGVTRVLVGGMFLTISENDLYVSQCVGDAIRSLNPYFQVKISNFTSPSGRADVRNTRKSLFKKNL